MTTVNWLQDLPAHPIFKPVTEKPAEETGGPQRKQRIACRGADLIVAVGDEIRITSLLETKTAVGGKSAQHLSSQRLHYKNLRHPVLDFPIQQLSVNPTGKLIAIAGTHLVVVLRLPKTRQFKSLNQDLDCDGGLVGAELYHSESSKVAKIEWHPWGEDGKSLLILTEDGILREFDVQRDCDEPQQEVSFLSDGLPARRRGSSGKTPVKATTKRRRGFGVPDEEAQSAVSFSIGQGSGDWGSMTVYGLMANGDVWALCPVLPSRCSLPESYVDALNVFLQYKANQLLAEKPIKETGDVFRDARIRRLAAQRRFADILASQIIAQKSSGAGIGNVGTDQTYTITLPNSKYLNDSKPLKRQGPFLFKPAPEELVLSAETGPRVEGAASDIKVLPGTGAHSAANGKGKDDDEALQLTSSGSGVGVVAIAWKDGRVDMCLEVAKVEALWVEDDLDDEHDTPCFAVYETIDLGLLPEIRNAPGHTGSITSRYSILVNDPPSFISDPMDESTFYVAHALGVHRVSVAPWMDALTAALAEDEEEKLDQFWESGLKSDSTWAIDALDQRRIATNGAVTGLALVSDLRVGTTLISMTASRHVVALDLMATATSAPDPLMTPTKVHESPRKPAYTSLLAQQAYDVRSQDFDRILANLQVRSMIPPGKGKQPIQSITADDLRLFAQVTQKFAAAIKEVRSTSSHVEGRLDLQVEEVARQLKNVKSIIAQIRAVNGEDDSAVRQALPEFDTTDTLGYLRERSKQLIEKQQDITERLQKAMQTMMDNAHPDLSLQEKAWMQDLEKMQNVVEDEESSKSLKSRIRAVKEELDSLKSKIATPAESSDPSSSLSPQSLRMGRLERIEASLAHKTGTIDSMISEVDNLSRQLDSLQVEDN
ncbi:hypothetical protein QFC22_000846 [Naganishia vaughanmartiniae]|uniref:Uncharacterized protein n=1 Tax=Naganishia vaughanmartiniae TaxID=1424756 RepID=A0ACC2XK98_9TREE|nr:hypothetical protein QFC22_000846 [Naganishia vaughanmartiniae]